MSTNAADVILRLLANSASDSNKGRRRRRSSRQSSDEEISEGEMSGRSDDQEDDDEDEDDEGPVDEYDADYFRDAQDRADLMAMAEVDREQILFERAKKRTVLLDHRQVAKRLKRQEEANRGTRKGSGSTNRDSARRKNLYQLISRQSLVIIDRILTYLFILFSFLFMHSGSTRAKDTKTGNTKALADLKKAQERKRARRSHSPEPKRGRKGSVDYSDKSSSPSSEDEADYDSEPEVKKSTKSITRKPATLDELNSIRLGRDRLAKWCYNPFFRDTVIGCFVRLSLGLDRNRVHVFRIAEVVAVNKQQKIYSIGDAAATNLNLTLRHGAAEKNFTMDYVSNGQFTEDEFRRFEIQLRSDKTDIPTQDHVERKRKDIDAAKAYALNDREVNEILEMKKQLKQGRLNPIVHRTILEQQKMEQSTEDGALEIEEQLQRLRDTEANQKDMRADKLDVWAALNERNRKLNKATGREAEGRFAQEKKLKGTTGKDIDPFARRKTVPRLAAAVAAESTITSTPTSQTVFDTPSMPKPRLEEVILAHKAEFNFDIDLSD
ncbi:RNA polymerase-associated protein rtf1 [Mortierella sp. AD031]|nr:RNA polymerase-associated protein rtf1 [Mortierella sp. AD031]